MASSFSPSSTTILSSEQIQEIIRQCSKADKKILQQYPTPFISNYAPYSQNQLRDLHFNRDCALQWNTFYKNNGRKAYRDRHYILREFDEMKQELDSKKMFSSVETGKVENHSSESSTVAVRRERVQDSTKQQSPLNSVLLLDFGCGVGNLCLPMLDEYREVLVVVASDLSQVAMQSLQKEINQRELADRVYCEQSDLGSDHTEKTVPNLVLRGIKHIFGQARNSNDNNDNNNSSAISVFSSLVFVLCSVPQNLWNNVVLNIVNSLKCSLKELSTSQSKEKNGYLFFRDYCEDDLAMHRFQSHRAVVTTGEDAANTSTVKNNNNNDQNEEDDDDCVDDSNNPEDIAESNDNKKSSTYMRTNGTLSHFFTLKEVEDLFSPYFEILDLKMVTLAAPIRDVVSVDGQINERKFIQGKFLLKKQKSNE